jgi:signal peptidase
VLWWAVVVLLAYFAWPLQWGGGTTWVVVKGTSMQPNFHTGDIVIARKDSHHEIGDILVYRVPEEYMGAGKLIMHRLKAIREDGTYVIQGDNRDTPDAFIVGPQDVVGVERVHIPRVGTFMRLLSNWWFISGLVALFALVRLWPERPEEQAGPEEPVTAATPVDAPVDVPVPVPALVPGMGPGMVVGHSAASSTAPQPAPAAAARAAPPARAHVIVDGDGLAQAAWPGLPDRGARRRALEAAEAIGERFGAPVAVVFGPGAADDVADDVTDRAPVHAHAFAVVAPGAGSVVEQVRELVAARPAWMTVLVVTDRLEVADDVWALGASVMRCAAWLDLGLRVHASLPSASGP